MTASFDQTPLQQHPYRWRLSRAGFVNVWHYYENTFDISGGRLILRGTNGSGKSRALEMLLPFLLDADRRNMGTGSPVRMEDLMSAGAGEQGNRLGYMWLELCRAPDPAMAAESGTQYLTIGALVRYAVSTKEAKVWYFTTPLRVGVELRLLGADRQPLSRRDLGELITEERVTDVPDSHRERVRAEVFALSGHLGKERFDGLVKLLHTLRSPDVGNRIEEGRLPAILADALPPLSEDALTDAGQHLDGLTSTREDQRRLEEAREQVRAFLEVYRRYVTGVLTSSLQAVRASAGLVRDGEGTAARLAQLAAKLDQELAAQRSTSAELAERTEQLRAMLEGLRASPEYDSVEQLHRLTEVVRSLASAADAALGTAGNLRREEAGKVADTTKLADDVGQAVDAVCVELSPARQLLGAINLAHDLPLELRIVRAPGAAGVDIVRVDREEQPQRLPRPVAEVLTLVPGDMDGFIAAARTAEIAARTRSAQAGNRAADARALAAQRRKVDESMRAAEEARGRAAEDAEAAGRAAEERDDAALALVDQWRSWLADPDTVDLLAVSDWSTHALLGPLLMDRTVLCGERIDIELPVLDRAVNEAAEAASGVLATALARLADTDVADERAAAELRVEQQRLRSAQDPDPRHPAWVTVTDGIPLWRCLDFVPSLAAEHRAGLEAAMLASGLLTATVDVAGQLVAASGQLLISPAGEPTEPSLATVLAVDGASPLAAEDVEVLLERIGLAGSGATTWVGLDGTWGSGPLRGRHSIPAARHIGAAARAAARAVRLAEIDSELAALTRAALGRQAEREQLDARRRALRRRSDSAPSSAGLTQARTRAAESTRRADRASDQAKKLQGQADDLARAWADSDRHHRATCAEFSLPPDESSLTKVHNDAGEAVRHLGRVVANAATVIGRMDRYGDAVAGIASVAMQRAEAEGRAAVACQQWQAENTKLTTLRESVGAAAEQVQRQISTVEGQLRQTRDEHGRATQAVTELSRKAGTATAEATAARQRADELSTELRVQIGAMHDQLNQPGVVDAAFVSAPEEVFSELTADAADEDAGRLLGSLRRGRSDENALLRAQQAFEQAISGSYDVWATVAAGIRIFELLDADGRRPLARAAVEIDRQCEAGRLTLTEREHEVFSRFVLGEVGEELRRRLNQADTLVTAMNKSLRSIRTSHGIGVRLTWRLSEDVSGDIARIKALITTAAAVRTPAQDNELTGLLSARVAAEAVGEPTAGYAVHLRSALDYRAWHTVDVIITGPEEGRERRISRRAKLSQGETRFVSYVTLFAAVDAYLSGLDDTATSLRLILLDDAFAKVDEPTIAELLGLLVRLDVDFVMTGHALWGCVPQVPALDIYEICREDGTPAATAHVHWDGRNRHFLHAT